MAGVAWARTVHHDGSAVYVAAPQGLKLGSTVTLRLRVGANVPIERVLLRTCPDGEQALTPMTLVKQEATCNWWEITLRLTMPRTNYRFALMTAEGRWWYNAAGLSRHNPTDANDFVSLTNYDAPGWVQQTVFYQIFPDRFADGDPTNNVQEGEYTVRGHSVRTQQWGTLPGKQDTPSMEFFGGDLPGISQHLDYLSDLGIGALYLNPIFTSPSNHKYDVADYRHVDPHFGGDAALIALRRDLEARGIACILDIVPNHSSASHPWFQAAQADPHAPSAPFYTFRKHPNEYESWLGVASLPKLNYNSVALREEMYAGPNAIMRYWLRPPFAIDGWRIDVANMLGRQGETQLGHKIGRAIRRAIKVENPQAYLLGENFYDGSPHLQGDELDATMNYVGFTTPLLAWLYNGGNTPPPGTNSWYEPHPLPTDALAAQWQAYRSAIPWQIATQQFNMLSSHDIPRIWTILGGDEDRLHAAVGLLFTYPGVPCVYYGDEIGMEGGADPDNRRSMSWKQETWHTGLHDLYRRLIHLRRTSPALCGGGFQMLYAENDTLAFIREAASERLIVVAQRSPDGTQLLPVYAAGLENGTRCRDLLTGTEAVVADGYLPLVGGRGAGIQIWRVV